jgi:hypothetical protein
MIKALMKALTAKITDDMQCDETPMKGLVTLRKEIEARHEQQDNTN